MRANSKIAETKTNYYLFSMLATSNQMPHSRNSNVRALNEIADRRFSLSAFDSGMACDCCSTIIKRRADLHLHWHWHCLNVAQSDCRIRKSPDPQINSASNSFFQDSRFTFHPSTFIVELEIYDFSHQLLLPLGMIELLSSRSRTAVLSSLF